MSSKSRKRRKELKTVEAKELDDFSAPARHQNKAGQIMDYILCLTDDDSAIRSLFPLPKSKHNHV